MPAPKNNKFWELRSTHGKGRIFKTPKIMLDAAYEYFDWCLENPLIEIVFAGKDAERREVPKMRAFTMQGLCSFLHVNTQYFSAFKASMNGKSDKKSEDYRVIITHIEEIVYNQKFTGAAAGFLNANIIARDLGLSDKREIESPQIAEAIVNTFDKLFEKQNED